MEIVSFSEVNSYLEKEAWLLATVSQLQKDLSWQSLVLPLSDCPTPEELQDKLSKLFLYLEEGQYQTLMNILYRVDVGEEKIKKAMEQSIDQSFSEVLAQLMLHRCLQKVITKKHFSQLKNTRGQDLLNQ